MSKDEKKILVVDDDPGHRAMLRANLEAAGYEVAEAADGDELLPTLARFPADLVILDLKMARVDGLAALDLLHKEGISVPVVVLTAFSSVDSAVTAMKRGAADYLTKPVDIDELEVVVARALEHDSLRREKEELEARLGEKTGAGGMIGESPLMRELFHTISLVAKSHATVLITGESGTGKELCAAAIHQQSPRKDGPFIKMNCAALNENLLESELFGHEKGAFTGADSRRRGRFEQADGGTLFLDEIGDMSPATQAKVLRVIQEGEFEPLGSERTVRVDVRIIAATHRDLAAMVEEKDFRQDLFFRLNVVPVTIPPLRERPGDIPPLARLFLARYAKKNRKELKGITPRAISLLAAHSWPGNVRELENVIERAVILCQGEEISHLDLPPQIAGESDPTPSPTPGLTMKEMEREMIRDALAATNNNRSHAAKRLGISRQTLLNKIREFGL